MREKQNSNLSCEKIPVKNPVFQGYRLSLPSEVPENREDFVIYRPKHTIFNYCAWPSSCIDENGTIYAVSGAFRTGHTCPFGKIAMYISRNGGRKWTCPIIVADDNLEECIAGISYLGEGRLMLSWWSKPADINYFELYNRQVGKIWGGKGSRLGDLRGAMMDLYSEFPADELAGGSFVKISEDYGVTWSDPVRLPVMNVLGATCCRDGSILFFGKKFVTSEEIVSERFRTAGPEERITAETWDEYAAKLNGSRWGRDLMSNPVCAYASSDGGMTWELRGVCLKPEGLKWENAMEPYAFELPDGTLLGAIRAEYEVGFENDFVVYLSRSSDGGRNWSPWECTHIAGSPPHLMMHSSGALIMTVSRRVGEELGQYAIISYDGGKTWTKEYAVNNRGINYDLGQPSTVELNDGSLVTTYYQRYVDPQTGEADAVPCIMCTRWRLN